MSGTEGTKGVGGADGTERAGGVGRNSDNGGNGVERSGNDGKTLTEELLSWPGVTTHPHRFGGVEFQLNGKEIGHLHGDHLFDLLASRAERDRWIGEGKAKPHHIYPDSGWLSMYMNDEQDVAYAIEIARSKYDQMILRRPSE